MKKIILLIILSMLTVFCSKKVSENDSEIIITSEIMEEPEIDSKNIEELERDEIAEKNRKLIEACNSMDSFLDSDIKDDILTIKINYSSKSEAQSMADGMLKEVKKYNNHINTVVICDVEYNILGYAGK